jgi:hypothetical protein
MSDLQFTKGEKPKAKVIPKQKQIFLFRHWVTPLVVLPPFFGKEKEKKERKSLGNHAYGVDIYVRRVYMQYHKD